ncbi:MAG: hypothetical protein RIG61_03960 [Deltaproteobacteria bacterium]
MSIAQKKGRKTRFLSTLIAFLAVSMAAAIFPQSEAKAELNESPGIKITDWSFYAAWGMSTMHNVTIENTSDVAYKEIKVRVSYYLSYYPTQPSTAVLVLPVNLPPRSKDTYLEGGLASLIVNPGGMFGMHLSSGEIEVLEAVPETAETNARISRKDI